MIAEVGVDMIVVAIAFAGVLFLGCLGFTIFVPRWYGPQPPNVSYFWEEMWLGKGPDFKARLRAFRVYQGRRRRTAVSLLRIMGSLMTVMAAIFLLILIAALVFPNSSAAESVGSFIISNAMYILLPIFIALGIAVLLWMSFTLKLWISKDAAPIRIRNLTNKILKLYIQGKFINQIAPGTELDNKKVLAIYEKYNIEAKNDEDNTVFSAELDLDELDKTEWVVTIG